MTCLSPSDEEPRPAVTPYVSGRNVALGRSLITRNAQACLPSVDILVALQRHAHADWRDVTEEDREANEYALTHALRLLSAYHARNGRKFWVITEADRSATTVLLPEDS